MDFKQLNYFVHIADAGNMTRASEVLRIAQPALSAQIANLEAELGTRLFDRSVLGVKLTPSAHVLYRYAKSLLKQLEDAKSAVREESDHPSGKVTIGISGSIGKLISVPLLRRVAMQDRILLEIVERPSADLLSLVAAGRLDIAIVVDAQPCKGASLTALILEDLYVIMKGERGKAKAKSQVTLQELAAQPLILPAHPSTIRQRVDTAFMNAHLKYRLVGEVSATDMLIRMITAGLGWTVLPWAAVGEEAKRGSIRAAPLSRSRMSRELSICISDSVPLSRAAEVIRGYVLSILDDLIAGKTWVGAESIPQKSVKS